MDCEKFETTMIDELYDELDELTSAAAKRHVAGCARCAALIDGLRATRRVAVLPLIEVPDGLEDRILVAARNAQKVVPLKGRIGRAVSWAGSWAMRPQTAMAAVFLVMVGSSLVLLRARSKSELAQAPGVVTVMEQGTPTPVGENKETDEERKGGGRSESTLALSPPATATATPTSAATSAPMASVATLDFDGKKDRDLSQLQESPYEARKSANVATKKAERDDSRYLNAGPVAGVPQLPQAAPPPAAGARGATTPAANAWADKELNEVQAQQQVSPAFARGQSSYAAGRYDEATRLFDSLAANDINAQYAAAKAVRDGHGCAAAVPRLEAVIARAGQTPLGFDATLDAGTCYRLMGRNDLAKLRLESLLAVQSHHDRAQAQLQALNSAQNQNARARPARQAAPQATATMQAAPAAPPPAAKAADEAKAYSY